MNKYNNPRLLNTVVSGTGMKNPVRPHVIIGSEENGFIRGDLMDANAIQELIVTEIAAREHGDEELTEYIDEKVQLAVDDLVDGAPEVLDTLKELSEALGDDANFATTITEEIASKVDKVEGKGLSTNDYTTAEKQKLAGIAAGAEVNVQSDWNVTSSSNDAFIKNKPTKVSQFTNDALYATTGLLQNVKRKYINPIYKKTPDLYDILYSDGTISAEVISDKTPVAVCVDDGTYFGDGVARFATGIIAEEKWSVDETETTATSNTDGKSNTNALTGRDFPAAAACINYRPGTHDGEWYLPASNELRCMYEKLSMLRHTYEHCGMDGLPSGLSSWSSTQTSAQSAVVVLDSLMIAMSSLKTGKQKVIAFLTISTFTESGKVVDIESALPKYDPTNGHEYVDLGLPSGTLWATMNVGATTPEETGNYYMYGMGARTYDSTDKPYDGTEIPLDLSKDTARQVWGGDWYTPTKELFDELVTNTTYSWVTDYNGSGLNGGLFTAENNNSIFIPAAGGDDSSTLLRSMPNQHGRYWTSEPVINDHTDEVGRYWTSEPVINDHTDEVLSTDSWYFEVNSYGARSNSNWASRTFAYSIRPVINSIEKGFKEVASKDDVDELKENLTFTETTDPANGHEYVDLGLPSGTKWATMNVGASSETDAGLYFQWGDTQGYTADQVGSGEGQKVFAWSDYKFNPSGDGETFTKYNETDGKTILDIEDDAVAANWGGSWKMPTEEQSRELVNRTDKEWTTINNVNGYKFTSKTDSSKYIFIPAASIFLDGQIGKGNSVWSGSRVGNGVGGAWSLDFASDYSGVYMNSVYFGNTVRGVLDGDAQEETITTPVKEVVTDLKSNEEVIAAALNNLNTKIEAINDTLNRLIARGGNAGGGTSM